MDISQAKLRDDRSTERLVDLAMYLQKSPRGFTRDEIGRDVPNYNTQDADNFGRMFERDKVELMAIGFDIEVVQADAWNQDEFRYRIVPAANMLPDINFTEAEMRVLVQATQAWNQTSLNDDAEQTRLKLEAFGVTIENQIPVAEFSGASELKTLAHGLATRRVVKFDYRKPGQDTSQQRSLEPWGMALRSGSWYVYGFDRDRQGPRCFNLSRITSSVSAVGKAQSFEIPENVDVNELLNPSQSNAAAISVKLKIASGSGHYWLERAQQVSDSGGDYEVTVALTTPRLQIPRLAADAPGVVVLEPQDIRQEVISLIQGAL